MSDNGESKAAAVDDGRQLYELKEYQTSFTLPKRVNVRQSLLYRGRVGRARGDDYYIKYWEAGQALIEDWQSELVPDPAAVDLETEDNPAVADIVFWAANCVAGHMLNLGGESVPKNS